MKRYPRDNPGISVCVHISGITLGYSWTRGTYPRGLVSSPDEQPQSSERPGTNDPEPECSASASESVVKVNLSLT